MNSKNISKIKEEILHLIETIDLKKHLMVERIIAALTVKRKETSYKILIKYLEIVLIFVNFLISVTIKLGKLKLYGKHFLNYKHMHNSIVLSFLVIFAS